MEVSTESSEKKASHEAPVHADTASAKRKAHGVTSPVLPVLVGIIALAAVGVVPRLQNQTELNKTHEQLQKQVTEVAAVVAKSGSEQQSLSLPGDLQPIQNIPVYARANGYLLKRFVDIGDNVKAGELLAIIDTPELDQQVQQAMANLRAAEANLASAISDRENYSAQLFAADATIKQNRTNLEYSTTEVQRYKMLAGEGAVSYEQRDQALRQYNSDTAAIEVAQHNRQAQLAQVASANARIAAAKQTVESNQASLSQLKALQNFQKVIAPADGVITNRLVDAGALVAAGGAQGTTQILSMAKTDTLRIYVDVPQSDYRYIHNGDKAELLLQEYPGQSFTGIVTNIAGSLNSQTRTLQTEIRIDNKNHILKPGSYADVRFHFNNPNPPVIIPSNAAVTKNDGLYVAVVNDGKVAYHKVEVARDYGNSIAISQGLKANDVVALDPPDGLSDGSKVEVKIAKANL
ncbi:MAG TPA: efflux RND transporter periplasmic adaptor subunit [Oculatellaceae cyanobacterium]